MDATSKGNDEARKAISLGALKPNTFIGKLLIQFSILIISSSVIVSKLVPLGKNLLINPLIFSVVPLSLLQYGRAKYDFVLSFSIYFQACKYN